MPAKGSLDGSPHSTQVRSLSSENVAVAESRGTPTTRTGRAGRPGGVWLNWQRPPTGHPRPPPGLRDSGPAAGQPWRRRARLRQVEGRCPPLCLPLHLSLQPGAPAVGTAPAATCSALSSPCNRRPDRGAGRQVAVANDRLYSRQPHPTLQGKFAPESRSVNHGIFFACLLPPPIPYPAESCCTLTPAPAPASAHRHRHRLLHLHLRRSASPGLTASPTCPTAHVRVAYGC